MQSLRLLPLLLVFLVFPWVEDWWSRGGGSAVLEQRIDLVLLKRTVINIFFPSVSVPLLL
jgi:hypothetical protein